MHVPQAVTQYEDAQWWLFLHVGVPVILVGAVVAGVVAWVYQRFYDK